MAWIYRGLQRFTGGLQGVYRGLQGSQKTGIVFGAGLISMEVGRVSVSTLVPPTQGVRSGACGLAHTHCLIYTLPYI